MNLDVSRWRWWNDANERRAFLIGMKAHKEPMTDAEKAEYAVLQGLAELICTGTTAPFNLSPLEEIAKKAERLAAKIQKQLHKSSEMKV
jgi:hypothetical protein